MKVHIDFKINFEMVLSLYRKVKVLLYAGLDASIRSLPAITGLNNSDELWQIRDYLSPKPVPSPKSKDPNPEPQNNNPTLQR